MIRLNWFVLFLFAGVDSLWGEGFICGGGDKNGVDGGERSGLKILTCLGCLYKYEKAPPLSIIGFDLDLNKSALNNYKNK